MRSSLRAFVLGSALAGLSAGIAASRSDDPSNWSLETWVSWRDDQIRRILSQNDPAVPITRLQVAERSDDAARFLERAQPRLATDPRLAEAIDHFRRFVNAQRRLVLRDGSGSLDHCYGMDIPDRAYLDAARADGEIPELLRSPDFLRLLARPEGYRRAHAAIEALNTSLPEERKWKVVLFRSQFVRSVDRVTYGRMLVVVPNVPTVDGGTVDRWVQFGIATPEQGPAADPRSVSVVAIHRHPGSDRSTCYLLDYLRSQDPTTGEIEPVPTAQVPDDPSTACYSCHKSGVVPIRPKVEYGFDPEGHLAPLPADAPRPSDQVNRMITAYGTIAVNNVTAFDSGPSLGVPPDQDPSAMISQVAGSMLSPGSKQRVRAALDCGKCHDRFPALNYPLALHTDADESAFEAKAGLVQSYVEKGWMPPGNTLTPVERQIVWKSALKSYFDPVNGTGKLIDWLKEDAP